MRLELRIGVFDFNGWSADQPIGKVNSCQNIMLKEKVNSYPTIMIIQNVNICRFKISGQTYSQAKYVFENVLELEEHTPTGPIVMNICKPELTKVIPVDLNPNFLKLTRFFARK